MQAKGSRLVLLGISNSIDLTERVLPELRARGADPLLLPFASYSRADIVTLLRHRLAPLPGPVFSGPSLEFCARKVGRILTTCPVTRSSGYDVGSCDRSDVLCFIEACTGDCIL